MEKQLLTNREGSKNDPEFLRACEAAKVKPTIRQYSKYRNHHGAAYEAYRRKGIVEQE